MAFTKNCVLALLLMAGVFLVIGLIAGIGLLYEWVSTSFGMVPGIIFAAICVVLFVGFLLTITEDR